MEKAHVKIIPFDTSNNHYYVTVYRGKETINLQLSEMTNKNKKSLNSLVRKAILEMKKINKTIDSIN